MSPLHRVAHLRDRLVLAAAGALPLVACSEPPAPQHASGVESATPVVAHEANWPNPPETPETPRSAMTISEAPSAGPVASTPPKPTEIPRTPPQNCFNTFSAARSVGTGERAPTPPPSSFDIHGCLPANQVSNSCCIGASAGPRFVDGFCCYSFPNVGACCGRPYTVDGDARRAPVVRSRAWLTIRADEVPRASDARASRWLGDAVMEHASIASFARFVLDLLALGAPAVLVRGALVAQGDEIAHAHLCFDASARLSGLARGPGALEVARRGAARSLETIVRDAVAEGCVAEAMAADDAAARRDVEADPELRATLARIAEDEARHAALAWSFVRWIVDREGDVAAGWVDDVLSLRAGGASPDPVVQTRSA